MQICGSSRFLVGQAQHVRPISTVRSGGQDRQPCTPTSSKVISGTSKLALSKKVIVQKRAGAGICQALPQPVVSAAAVAAEPEVSAFDELAAGTERKYIMISGKGGVGKTSLSASLAIKLAAAGHTTLVVSTDPAHSLSDSLDQDVSGGKPVPLEGTDLPLWGMEVDPEEATGEFRRTSQESMKGEGVQNFMANIGLGLVAEQLADLKLGELLNTPPPGLDEAVATVKVVDFAEKYEYARFTRIVFDTAPTGHTLRLLSLPDFVESSLGKIIRLRKKLASATAVVRSLFGTSEDQDETVAKLEVMQHRIQLVKNLFRNKETTEFVIATIPTYMAVDESARLLQQLHKDNINCKRIVVNQVVGEKTGETYVRMKLKDQQQSLAFLREDPALSQLTKIEAPVIDLEVRGVPALSYFGNLVWSDVYDSMNAGADRKFFLMGGKGGVGKTSCAASLAVKFASDGYPTLIVSTDPAHSVSDSLDQGIGGGKPMPVISPLGDIPLYAMETDPEQARAELRQAMSDENSKKLNEVLDALGMGTVADQLKDLQLGDLLDTPPPGVDEAVAISKVVQLVKNPQYSHFKRIIFDTAPTGHTLRLLTLPEFLDNTIGKLVRLRQKLSLNAVKSFFTGKEEKDPAVEKLDELKGRMAEARDLFRNKNSTEFVIVTIPTMMAVSESSRLAAALKDDNIPVNKIVVNQVLQDNATEKLLATRRADQQRALSHMREDPGLKELQVIQGPLIDLEVRGVPALMYYGSQVWK